MHSLIPIWHVLLSLCMCFLSLNVILPVSPFAVSKAATGLQRPAVYSEHAFFAIEVRDLVDAMLAEARA